MKWRMLLLSAGFLAAPAAAVASCGAENCPLDHPIRWSDAPFAFDVSYQYIDQGQPRIGTDDATVGEIPGLHDEVRTLSRTTTAAATYRLAGAWSVGASLPYIDRYHEHNHNDVGGVEVEQWHYSGIGDVEFGARRLLGGGERWNRFFLSAGVKAPTGVPDAENEDGDRPEPAAQIGSGSWDLLGGFGAEWLLGGAGGAESVDGIPLRLSVTGRWNGQGTDDYRIGAQALINAASELPIGRTFALLGQVNYRVRAKDDPGSSGEDDADTGGSWLYLSPGLRVSTGGLASIYGLVQIPIYQRVNGIQLVSEANLYFGVTGGVF